MSFLKVGAWASSLPEVSTSSFIKIKPGVREVVTFMLPVSLLVKCGGCLEMKGSIVYNMTPALSTLGAQCDGS